MYTIKVIDSDKGTEKCIVRYSSDWLALIVFNQLKEDFPKDVITLTYNPEKVKWEEITYLDRRALTRHVLKAKEGKK